MVTTVSVSLFESARHARADTKITQSVRHCAQDYMPATNPRPSAGRKSAKVADNRRAGTRTKHASATPSSASHSKASNTAAGWARPASTRTKSGDPPLTLQGLCNRCGTGSFAKLAPKFVSLAEREPEPDGLVRLIMTNIGSTDTASATFVRILSHLRELPELRTDDGLSSYVATFVDADPHLLRPAPDPASDYDGFCDYVSERESKLRITDALISLGFLERFIPLVDAALDVVQDPASAYDKGSAVKFCILCVERGLRIGSKSSCPAWVARALVRVDEIVRGFVTSSSVMDKRTQFAMLDLSRRRANIVPSRKVAR